MFSFENFGKFENIFGNQKRYVNHSPRSVNNYIGFLIVLHPPSGASFLLRTPCHKSKVASWYVNRLQFLGFYSITRIMGQSGSHNWGRHQKFWKIDIYTFIISKKEQRWRVFKFYFEFLSFVVNQAG